jgi:RNA polymerase sigma factor (sigma-70 family)
MYDDIQAEYDMANDINHSYVDFEERIDLEIFIHQLTYRETVVILFKYMGMPIKEIGKILGLHASNIYKIIESVENKLKNKDIM